MRGQDIFMHETALMEEWDSILNLDLFITFMKTRGVEVASECM